MKIHPRSIVVDKAALDAAVALDGIANNYHLTTTELFIIINRYQSNILKFALRSERHPDDPSNPADVE